MTRTDPPPHATAARRPPTPSTPPAPPAPPAPRPHAGAVVAVLEVLAQLARGGATSLRLPGADDEPLDARIRRRIALGAPGEVAAPAAPGAGDR